MILFNNFSAQIIQSVLLNTLLAVPLFLCTQFSDGYYECYQY